VVVILGMVSVDELIQIKSAAINAHLVPTTHSIVKTVPSTIFGMSAIKCHFLLGTTDKCDERYNNVFLPN